MPSLSFAKWKHGEQHNTDAFDAIPDLITLRDDFDTLRSDFDAHRGAIPIDHPDASITTAKIADRAVTRAKLEYSTDKIVFDYLICIDKAMGLEILINRDICGRISIDSFTDKGVQAYLFGGGTDRIFVRWQDVDNWYSSYIEDGEATADHQIRLMRAGSESTLGTESVDVGTVWMKCKFEAIGSTLNSYREDLTTPAITVTDTTFSSGKFGVKYYGHGNNGLTGFYAVLYTPSTTTRRPLAILEYEVGEQSIIRPSQIITIDEALQKGYKLPEEIVRRYKIYQSLKNKGFTDEEIKDLFGTFKTKIDVLSISWGSIDFKKEDGTVHVCIYSNNPYNSNALDEHISFVKNKGLDVITTIDRSKLIDIYSQIRKKRPSIMITENELAFQLFGDKKSMLMSLADFYEREVLNLNRIKDVPFEILRYTIVRYIEDAKKLNLDYVVEKLTKVLKI